jgi:hypothetical protein
MTTILELYGASSLIATVALLAFGWARGRGAAI